MRHVVLFSGGAASALVAHLVAREHGKENTVLLFHDTKAEHEDAARFRRQVSEKIGIEITEVSDGRSLWDLIEQYKSLPSHFHPWCTTRLKQDPGGKYFKQLKSEGHEFIKYNGFGFEEWRRVQRAWARSESEGMTTKSPLFDLRIPAPEVKRIIREDWKICLPQPYIYLDHNNCLPCFKAGKHHFRKICLHYPEAFEKAKRAEEIAGRTVFENEPLSELETKWKGGQLELDIGSEYLPCMCAL